MRILADENVHGAVVLGLRVAGHAVEWVADTMPGSTDAAILARPDAGEWVLLTYDRDFGELIFRRGAPWPLAIIHSRLGRADPAVLLARLVRLLADSVPHHHMIIILPDDDERRRPFEARNHG